MAISSFMGLQTALRGLLAEQTAIDTTGHNIANANTPGYSRQSADLVTSTPLTVPAYSNVTGGGVQLGTGVDVATINRIRNTFLDVQYRSQNTTSYDASTRAGILDQVQTGLAEPSDHGIASQLSAFWNAWSDVANAPQSQAARQTLINSATTLANSFNQFDSQLSTIQSQAATQYADLTSTTGQVESDANQINKKMEYLRQAFVSLGFDGIIDRTAGKRFAWRAKNSPAGNVAHLDKKVIHYVAFSPAQVQLLAPVKHISEDARALAQAILPPAIAPAATKAPALPEDPSV